MMRERLEKYQDRKLLLQVPGERSYQLPRHLGYIRAMPLRSPVCLATVFRMPVYCNPSHTMITEKFPPSNA